MNATAVIKSRIVQLCDERNISVNELADIAGLNSATVQNIMNESTTKVQLLTVNKICIALDIDLKEFFNCDSFDNLCKKRQW